MKFSDDFGDITRTYAMCREILRNVEFCQILSKSLCWGGGSNLEVGYSLVRLFGHAESRLPPDRGNDEEARKSNTLTLNHFHFTSQVVGCGQVP